MAIKFNGTNQAGVVALKLAQYNKLTVGGWFWNDTNDTSDDLLLEFTSNTNTQDGGFFINQNNSGGGALVNVRFAGGNTSRLILSSPAQSAWHYWMLPLDGTVGGAAAIPAVYIDGVSQSFGGGASSAGTGNFVNDNLNIMSRNNASLFCAGRVADLAIWGGVLLTAAEAIYLARGGSPLRIKRSSLVSYWPLNESPGVLRDFAGSGTGTVSGTLIGGPAVLGNIIDAKRIWPGIDALGFMPTRAAPAAGTTYPNLRFPRLGPRGRRYG